MGKGWKYRFERYRWNTWTLRYVGVLSPIHGIQDAALLKTLGLDTNPRFDLPRQCWWCPGRTISFLVRYNYLAQHTLELRYFATSTFNVEDQHYQTEVRFEDLEDHCRWDKCRVLNRFKCGNTIVQVFNNTIISSHSLQTAIWFLSQHQVQTQRPALQENIPHISSNFGRCRYTMRFGPRYCGIWVRALNADYYGINTQIRKLSTQVVRLFASTRARWLWIAM